jgi:predicted TIM-barrel fold metal-dependent hydrolase
MNGFFIENWLPADPRYHLAIMIAPHDPARAAVEIRRRQATPRVAGILLPLLNILMGDRHYHPIYRAAVQHGLPVIVHPTGPEAAYYGAPVVAGGVPATFIERHVALPQIAQANISSLIMNGVFERFPGLKVVFAGYGFAWLIALQWRMDMDWRRLRRETPWVRKAPSDYIRENIRLTLQPMEEAEPAQFDKLLEMLAADRTLLFSSDYPHWDRVDLPELAARFPERYRAAVLRVSALETFGSRITGAVPAGV